MTDAGPGRHDAQIGELALRPTQQRVALAVALHLELHVAAAGVGHAAAVHLHRVVDHQVDRHAGVDQLGSPPLRATAERSAARSTTQGTPVKSCSSTRAGHEGEFGAVGGCGVPIEQGQHILLLLPPPGRSGAAAFSRRIRMLTARRQLAPRSRGREHPEEPRAADRGRARRARKRSQVRDPDVPRSSCGQRPEASAVVRSATVRLSYRYTRSPRAPPASRFMATLLSART